MIWVLLALLLLGGGALAAAEVSPAAPPLPSDQGSDTSSDSTDVIDLTQYAQSDPFQIDMTSSDTIEQMALAIQQREGYAPGSRSYRNNNPGNLRPPSGKTNYWPGQIGVDSGGFAIFDSYQSGFAALQSDLRAHIARNPNQSLSDYIASYAPSSDGNDPVSYASFIADALGVDVNTQLGDL